MSRTFQEKLQLLAHQAIHGGVCLAPGQELILRSDVSQAEFAKLIAIEAYKAGAKNVVTFFSDETARKVPFEYGEDSVLDYFPKWLVDSTFTALKQNAAFLAISSENPMNLQSVEPAKVARQAKARDLASKELGECMSDFRTNWSIVGAASRPWAQLVFPKDAPEVALEKLWDAIFLTSRIHEEEPLAAWKNHCNSLGNRRKLLNHLELNKVHFTGPGTDLHVGLAAGAIWQGGWGMAKNGVQCGPNIPTEEVFTMPHRAKVNGTVSSTKPLSLRGQVIDGIKVEFKDGAVVHATAQKGEETFLKLLETDEGSKHLGEVALVPNSALTSRAGVLFYNTLYDENAASHIALGRCYSENMEGFNDYSKEEQEARGANDSMSHVDWMIGSGEINVDGHCANGQVVPLMRSGEWVEKV